MIAFLGNFVGLWFIAGALIAIVVDGTKSIAASELTITPIGQTWLSLSPGSLSALQQGIEAHLTHWVWDPLALTILGLPTWLLLGAIGVVLVYAAQPRRRRRRRVVTG